MSQKLEDLKEAINEAIINGFRTPVNEFNPDKFKLALLVEQAYGDGDVLTIAQQVIRKILHKVGDLTDEKAPFAFFVKKDVFGKKEAKLLPHKAHSNEKLIQFFLLDARQQVIGAATPAGKKPYTDENDCFLFIAPLINGAPTAVFLLQVIKDPKMSGAPTALLSFNPQAFKSGDATFEDLLDKAKRAKLIKI